MGCTSSTAAPSPKRAHEQQAERQAAETSKRLAELRNSDLQRNLLSLPAAFKRCHIHSRHVDQDYVTEGRVLGSGFTGDVRLARSRLSGCNVALKCFELGGCVEDLERAFDEAEIFLSLDHPHIVRLYDVYLSEEQLCLVMECMEGGELFERVRRCKRLTEAVAAGALRQMLLAVAYLHAKGIAHCDVKPENFLFEELDGDFLKLCDFGFSQLCPPNSALWKVIGTPKYMSPGVYQGHYTTTSDLWSMGVVAFVLLQGSMPFGDSGGALTRKILSGRWSSGPESWSQHSPGALDFVKGLLEMDPSKRLTARQALEHPWLRAHRAPVPEEPKLFENLRAFSRSTPLQQASFFAMAWTLSPGERSRVREAFLDLNESRTGSLDFEELRRAFERHRVGEAEARAVFEALDVAGSGQVAYSDFLAAMCCSGKIPLCDAHVKEVFACFDVDGTGLLTRECFARASGAPDSPSHDSRVERCSSSMAPEDTISEAQFQLLLQSVSHTEIQLES